MGWAGFQERAERAGDLARQLSRRENRPATGPMRGYGGGLRWVRGFQRTIFPGGAPLQARGGVRGNGTQSPDPSRERLHEQH